VTVGPVILSVDNAREHLETHGSVYSYRTQDRTTGQTWYRTSRTGEKIGDCEIELAARVYEWQDLSAALRPFAPRSGFGTVDEWRLAIEDVHGAIEGRGYIYRITTGDDDAE